jgi:monovalent cation:proton antiporter-2 (CPA2) family protein
MNFFPLLLGTFVYLTAAVIAAPLAARLGLGSVLGYLVAGIVIGPAVLGLVGSEGQDVMHFAEFGVIVMLFLVGLELQPSKLWSLRKPILGLGGLQVIATTGAIAGVALALGLSSASALATGLILSMSSTAIVIQSLTERGELKTTSGQSAFSVLLFQDISVIPMLALLPLLATQQADNGHSTSLIAGLPVWLQTLCILAAVAAIVLGGRFLMRPLFRFVAQSGIREIFVAFALVIVVGITLLMQFVGLSAALGTFLAGVVLAESEYRHELEMDLDPFKGLLLAVFFMAVGAGIDFRLLLAQPLLILALLAAFIIVKLLVLYGVARVFRMPGSASADFAFNLAQGGEFAFVLISFCLGLGLLAAGQAAILVALVALSMALSPLVMMLNERVIQPLYAKADPERPADTINHRARVIIAGHGRFGMTVGRLLQAMGHPAVVLDHDAEQIEALRRFGYRLFYGDASRLDLLEAAGAHDATILIIAIDDRDKINEIVVTARKHFPHLEIFARSFDRVHSYELLNAGAQHVYREVYGSSLDLGRDVLVALGEHPFAAHRSAQKFRAHDEKTLLAAARHLGDTDTIIDITRKSRSELTRILDSDRARSPIAADDAWSDTDGQPG